MNFLKKNIIKKITLFVISIYSLNIYANTNKTTSNNDFQIVTMQPIADINDESNGIDIDNLHQYSNNLDTIIISDKNLKNKKFSKQDLKCLTQTIYFEAKNEGYAGGVAVGNVVMNRVKSGKFPTTICGVMTQKTRNMCQFSFMCNGQINQKIHNGQWQQSQKIALDILNGVAPKLSNGALFFHAKYAKLRLASNRYTAKIGHHYFYK